MWKKQIVWLISISFIWTFQAQAKEVIAIGTAGIFGSNVGSARNQALQNAQRQAVEQGVGAFLDSQTLSQNFEVIKDEIFSTSRGFVERYDILEEGKTADGSAYQVKIRAEVSDKKIEDKLGALKILHKKMGNKRVMVIYHSNDPKALPRNNGAVQTTFSSIRDELNQVGFRVFNERVMNEVYQVIEKSTIIDRPTESLLAIALDQHAEILVRFEMIAGKRNKAGGQFHATKVTIRLEVYDASTGRQIADVVQHGKELSTYAPGPYDLYEMLGKAGKRAGAQASKDAITKIASYYQNVGDLGFAYLIVFRNYTVDEEDNILDYLEDTPGFNDLTELKNSPNYLEIELFSSESKSRLRRKIRRDLKTKGIDIASQESSGNRLIFLKPGVEEQ